jgi:hypothetical protein
MTTTIKNAMASIGFEPEHMGGNCMAYRRPLHDGELLLTWGDDALLPEDWNDDVVIGRYGTEHGEPLEEERYETVRAFVAATEAGTSLAARFAQNS